MPFYADRYGRDQRSRLISITASKSFHRHLKMLVIILSQFIQFGH